MATVAPNFWMNRANGVNYNVGVQTPQYRIDSLDTLLRTPVSVATGADNTTQRRARSRRGGRNEREHRRGAQSEPRKRMGIPARWPATPSFCPIWSRYTRR